MLDFKFDKIIRWLLEGDVSIQYQVFRDLLGEDKIELQNRISQEGYGARLLNCRNADGNWGQKFYFPKWTSTHYTLLDLRNLGIQSDHELIKESINIIIENEKASDGGILPIGVDGYSDLCINGMFLNYATYFKTDERFLKSVIDCILSQVMSDGGFNCRSNRSHCVHSSLHTTISILEGITEYEMNGYSYRVAELEKVKKTSIEFILLHQLYLSDRTGEIIKKDFTIPVFPCRWKYDILRALDYFQYEGVEWDERMQQAIEVLKSKRNKKGLWHNYAKHAGQVHFEMEKAGKPGRWNTLRALRVLKHFEVDHETVRA